MNGKELKILRKQKGLTQKEVSDAIGTIVQRISEWENGKNISKVYSRLLDNFFKK